MINEFRGETRWLSNFEMCQVMYDGVMYPSSEHAFQAAKTLDHMERNKILKAESAGKARKLGQNVTLREDWTPEKRIECMRIILWDKFTRNEWLKNRLIATGDEELIEGNAWGDKFWGVCDGEGENNLGKILMSIRETLKKERT